MRLKINFILFALLILNNFHVLYGQEYKISKVDSVFNLSFFKTDTLSNRAQFGGISGIEFHDNQLWMVSDRAFRKDTTQESFIFIADTLGNLLESRLFYGVKNVESIRYNSNLKKWFYAFEREDSTGIGYIDDLGLPHTLVGYSMKIDNPLILPNRGIESLCFDHENNLWFIIESAEKQFLWFRRVKFNSENGKYDFENIKVFPYPFEVNACLNSFQKNDANLGNGISEILHEGNGKFLVLERCFNGKNNVINIFRFSPYQGEVIKELVFEFTVNNQFLGTHTSLKPDNMEGMCWVVNQMGNRELYLISDDNFNTPRQRTLLLRLRN